MGDHHLGEGGSYNRKGQWAQIRVPRESEYELLARAVLDGDMPWQWRGYAPSAEAFRQTLWDGVLAQWIITATDDDDVVGHVMLYGASGPGKYCFLQAWLDRRVRRQGWPLEGVALAIDRAFHRFDMRKVMIEAPASVVDQYGSLLLVPGVEQEGLFRQHISLDGRWQDVYVMAIHREAWPSVLAKLFGFRSS